MKKLLASAIVAVSVLSAGTSAFAYGNAHEPDSPSSPNIFQSSVDDFDGTINNNVDAEVDPFDLDYYQWTNDTGNFKSFFVNFDTYQNRDLDYRIRSIGVTGVGSSMSRVSYSTGKETWHVYLAPWEKVTIQVGSSSLYKFDPNVKYVISLGERPW